MSSLIESIERQELVDKLREAGFGELVDMLLNNNKVYTKKGRLNKSGACRLMGLKTKQLEDALAECRELLRNEYED